MDPLLNPAMWLWVFYSLANLDSSPLGSFMRPILSFPEKFGFLILITVVIGLELGDDLFCISVD